MAEKKAIVNRLKSLSDLEDVTVTPSASGNTVRIKHPAHHSLQFVFKWVDDSHFVGYFLDANGNQSQAVLSLWSGLDTIQFAAAYSLLHAIRARQRA